MVCLFTSALNIVSNVSSKHEINKYKNWENLIYYFAKYINEADGGEGFPQLIPEGSHTWLGHQVQLFDCWSISAFLISESFFTHSVGPSVVSVVRETKQSNEIIICFLYAIFHNLKNRK